MCSFVVLVSGTLIYGRGDEAELKKAAGEQPDEPGTLSASSASYAGCAMAVMCGAAMSYMLEWLHSPGRVGASRSLCAHAALLACPASLASLVLLHLHASCMGRPQACN